MSPHLPPSLAGPPSLHPRFSRRFPQALADCGGCGRAGLLLGLRGSPAGLAGDSASGETSCCRACVPRRRERFCNLVFSAGNQSPGLAGKWTVAPGGFIFRVRQSTWVEAYNGVERRESRSWKEKPTNTEIHTLSFTSVPQLLPGLMKSLGCVFCCD